MSKVIKKTCSHPKCQKEQRLTEFYNTSEIEIFADGKLPICKTCCFDIFERKGYSGFLSIMKIINKPILQDVFKGDYKEYIKIMNSMPQYKDLSFLDSTMFDISKAGDKAVRMQREKEIELSELTVEEFYELEIFFGEGYSEKDYIYLSDEYSDYCSRYAVDSKALENLIKEIVLTQLEIRKARAQKQAVNALQKTLQDLLGSSNLKPVQESGAQAVDQESFGTLIKKWENERPIPEPDPAWKDVDGIGNYIKTYFLGHLSRVFGRQGENPYDDEYNEEIDKYTVKPPREDD